MLNSRKGPAAAARSMTVRAAADDGPPAAAAGCNRPTPCAALKELPGSGLSPAGIAPAAAYLAAAVLEGIHIRRPESSVRPPAEPGASLWRTSNRTADQRRNQQAQAAQYAAQDALLGIAFQQPASSSLSPPKPQHGLQDARCARLCVRMPAAAPAHGCQLKAAGTAGDNDTADSPSSGSDSSRRRRTSGDGKHGITSRNTRLQLQQQSLRATPGAGLSQAAARVVALAGQGRASKKHIRSLIYQLEAALAEWASDDDDALPNGGRTVNPDSWAAALPGESAVCWSLDNSSCEGQSSSWSGQRQDAGELDAHPVAPPAISCDGAAAQDRSGCSWQDDAVLQRWSPGSGGSVRKVTSPGMEPATSAGCFSTEPKLAAGGRAWDMWSSPQHCPPCQQQQQQQQRMLPSQCPCVFPDDSAMQTAGNSSASTHRAGGAAGRLVRRTLQQPLAALATTSAAFRTLDSSLSTAGAASGGMRDVQQTGSSAWPSAAGEQGCCAAAGGGGALLPSSPPWHPGVTASATGCRTTAGGALSLWTWLCGPTDSLSGRRAAAPPAAVLAGTAAGEFNFSRLPACVLLPDEIDGPVNVDAWPGGMFGCQSAAVLMPALAGVAGQPPSSGTALRQILAGPAGGGSATQPQQEQLVPGLSSPYSCSVFSWATTGSASTAGFGGSVAAATAQEAAAVTLKDDPIVDWCAAHQGCRSFHNPAAIGPAGLAMQHTEH